jgi:hypothetical protein
VGRDVIERLLLRRGEPLVDLGLARYGYSQEVLAAVFARGDCGVRCAVLSNPSLRGHCWSGDIPQGNLGGFDLRKVLQRGNKSELEALARNAYLDSFVYEAMIKRQGVFSELSDEN